jgi:hypothetical protein
LLERLIGCIDKGRRLVEDTQQQVAAYVETIRRVDATLNPASDGWAQRKRLYGSLGRELWADEDAIRQQMGRVMTSFKPGLFAGGGRADLPRDNLNRATGDWHREAHADRSRVVRPLKPSARSFCAQNNDSGDSPD